MPAETALSWLLDRGTGWRTLEADGVVAGATLRLAAIPDGPLGLLAADGTLGGLVLPSGTAFDDELTLHLILGDATIARFDPAAGELRRLPSIGGRGRRPRRFRSPGGLAIAGGDLYVADVHNRRLQVFDLRTLALRHLWGIEEMGSGWGPRDVASAGDAVYLLDRRGGRVFEHRPGWDVPQTIIEQGPPGAWTRIAADRERRLYLLHRRRRRLDVYAGARSVGSYSDPEDVRDRFEPTVLRVDDRGRLFLPRALSLPCRRTRPAAPSPLGFPPGSEGLLFDRRTGARIGPAGGEAYLPHGASFVTEGEWTSTPLDGEHHEFRWHRIELDVSELPAGTRLVAYTRSGEGPGGEWRPQPDYEVEGRLRPPSVRGDPAPQRHEFLVASPPGRFLAVRLELAGEGNATPVVAGVRVHAPRDTYLTYLPAVYTTADEASRSFLERFLSVVQTEWDDLDEKIAAFARHLDVEAVPEGSPLEYLAGWIGLPLEQAWDGARQRRLLALAPKLLGGRGTARALRAYLRVYLANLIGRDPERIAESPYPQLLEGFRERRHARLGHGSAALTGGGPLWSPAVVARLQLGEFAREGEARLLSTGAAEQDPFDLYAHRFKVVVPAKWVETAAAERLLRRAIEEEKPAHTHYDLCLAGGRLRVGVQSTVGVDAIVGTYPVARLRCHCDHGEATSRPPTGRLGLDTVLAGSRLRRARIGGHMTNVVLA
jgi:phage tail-like protein